MNHECPMCAQGNKPVAARTIAIIEDGAHNRITITESAYQRIMHEIEEAQKLLKYVEETMLTEDDVLKLFDPIKKEIDASSNLDEDGIAKIITTNFPSEDKIQQITKFLEGKGLSGFNSLIPEKRLDRTRHLVMAALDNAAKMYFKTKNNIEPDDEEDELIFSENEWMMEEDTFMDEE